MKKKNSNKRINDYSIQKASRTMIVTSLNYYYYFHLFSLHCKERRNAKASIKENDQSDKFWNQTGNKVLLRQNISAHCLCKQLAGCLHIAMAHVTNNNAIYGQTHHNITHNTYVYDSLNTVNIEIKPKKKCEEDKHNDEKWRNRRCRAAERKKNEMNKNNLKKNDGAINIGQNVSKHIKL